MASVAQLVEHLTVNQAIAGSNPAARPDSSVQGAVATWLDSTLSPLATARSTDTIGMSSNWQDGSL